MQIKLLKLNNFCYICILCAIKNAAEGTLPHFLGELVLELIFQSDGITLFRYHVITTLAEEGYSSEDQSQSEQW